MRSIDKRLQVIRSTVAGGGCKLQHTVVAPIAIPGEGRDRHQLHCGDPQVLEIPEPGAGSSERTLLREGPDVQFREYRPGPGSALPLRIAPCEGTGIDDGAGRVNTLRIAARGRIGD